MWLPSFLRRDDPAWRGLRTLTKDDIMPTAMDLITALKANVDSLKAQHATLKTSYAALQQEREDLAVSVSDLTTREANITKQLSDLSDGVQGFMTEPGAGAEPNAADGLLQAAGKPAATSDFAKVDALPQKAG